MGEYDGSGQLVVFEVSGHDYALPLEFVDEVVRMVAVIPVPAGPDWLAGVVDLRGRLIPMIDLRPRLGLAPADPDPGAFFVVASKGDRAVGVLADAVRQVLTVPAAEIERPDEMTEGEGIVTAVARSAGGVVLVLDLGRLSMGAEVTDGLQPAGDPA
jgi:purine-binding chemotaxis protein CheW